MSGTVAGIVARATVRPSAYRVAHMRLERAHHRPDRIRRLNSRLCRGLFGGTHDPCHQELDTENTVSPNVAVDEALLGLRRPAPGITPYAAGPGRQVTCGSGVRL